jgi:hypothetical protein
LAAKRRQNWATLIVRAAVGHTEGDSAFGVARCGLIDLVCQVKALPAAG